MPRRYVATFEYTEIVRGERRRFVHETIVEAAGPDEAQLAARAHFNELTRESGVTWQRALNKCDVAPARRGVAAKGGRRVEAEPS